MKKAFKFFGIIILVTVVGFSLAVCDNNDNNDNNHNINNNVVNENLIFNEDFKGTSLDSTKWALCPNLDRQGRSTWMDDMVSVNNGYLHIKFKLDPELGATRSNNPDIANNWIRAGGIRTLSKDWRTILFENTYGYYEARIKMPKISSVWGAFWLMSPTMEKDYLKENDFISGETGTEIDIFESLWSSYQAALHWNGYGEHHKTINSGSNHPSVPVDIYDGNFHTFAVNWTPTEYIFYVDNHEFWRVDGGPNFKNCGINRKPNYIKLTVESAPWQGPHPEGFTEGEMVVDYVRVYTQKPR